MNKIFNLSNTTNKQTVNEQKDQDKFFFEY